MANDIAIPIVFPDYLIAAGTPEVPIDVPDFLPGVPNIITFPAIKKKLPYLGHAGILFINGTSGLTKYYEYGRYDRAELGEVKRRPVPDARIAVNGRPTAASLEAVLARIRGVAGQGTRISGAYIELPTGSFSRMLTTADRRMADPKRADYALFSNSCLHFMKDVADAGGAGLPGVIAPNPAGYIKQVRFSFPDLDYNGPGTLKIEGITL